MRKVLIVSLIVAGLMASTVQARASVTSGTTNMTVVRTDSETCASQGVWVRGRNALHMTLWRMTQTMRLCWTGGGPNVIVDHSIDIEPYTSSWGMYQWDGIADRSAWWCDYHLCLYRKTVGSFHVCVPPGWCSYQYPWVSMTGYPHTNPIWPANGSGDWGLNQ